VSRYTTLGQNSGDAAVTGFGYAPTLMAVVHIKDSIDLGKSLASLL